MLTAEQHEECEIIAKHPEIFFKTVLGIDTLEDYQAKILRAIAENDRVAVSACHDVGKSWTLARAVLWYMIAHPYCKVITTAPTFNQVQNILWSEIRSAYARSKAPLGGKMNLTEWQLSPNGDWFAIGFTPRNELTGEAGQGTQSSFQGFHAAGGILIVFDEATGIPPNIWTMCEGMMTSEKVKFVAIGNPTSRSSEFYKCFSSADWSKIKLSCFDSPNLVANGIIDMASLKKEIDLVASMNDQDGLRRLSSYKVVRPHLLTLRWVVSMGLPRKWGTTHPLFVSKVLGKFPQKGDNDLISVETIEAAQLRVYWPTDSDRKIVGVDVARTGPDSTVMTALHGKKFLGKKVISKAGINVVVGEIINFAIETFGPDGADIIVVDDTGLAGTVDFLNEAKNADRPRIQRRTEIRGVIFGATKCMSEQDQGRFGNVKARMFHLLADDLVDENGLTLPREDIYLDELPTIRYDFDGKGRKIIEDKAAYKKRTGRGSPDHSDSLALANYGNYDELGVGVFGESFSAGYGKPFAAALGGDRRW